MRWLSVPADDLGAEQKILDLCQRDCPYNDIRLNLRSERDCQIDAVVMKCLGQFIIFEGTVFQFNIRITLL